MCEYQLGVPRCGVGVAGRQLLGLGGERRRVRFQGVDSALARMLRIFSNRVRRAPRPIAPILMQADVSVLSRLERPVPLAVPVADEEQVDRHARGDLFSHAEHSATNGVP